jgi:hypothetical protein
MTPYVSVCTRVCHGVSLVSSHESRPEILTQRTCVSREEEEEKEGDDRFECVSADHL